jgi:hypothetical protein
MLRYDKKSDDTRTLQMRKEAGAEPAIGWTGQVRFDEDHHALQ